MTASVAGSQGPKVVPFLYEEVGSKVPKTTPFPREDVPDRTGSPPTIPSPVQSMQELFVVTHHEELYGYVKKIIEDKAYVVFETGGVPLERAVKLSRLTAINADRQGSLIRLVVEERGASMITKFENLEEKGITTWRDKIKDEDLEKYDLLKKFALPRKSSNLH
jgi:hypothetical protein